MAPHTRSCLILKVLMIYDVYYVYYLYDQVCGEHFNKPGHSQSDMLPVILEEVTPKNDDFLRLRREELWIRKYQSIEFGANKHS